MLRSLVLGAVALAALLPWDAAAFDPSVQRALVSDGLAVAATELDAAIPAPSDTALVEFAGWLSLLVPDAPVQPGPLLASLGLTEPPAWPGGPHQTRRALLESILTLGLARDVSPDSHAILAQRASDLALLGSLWQHPSSAAITEWFAGLALASVVAASEAFASESQLSRELVSELEAAAKRSRITSLGGFFGPQESVATLHWRLSVETAQASVTLGELGPGVVAPSNEDRALVGLVDSALAEVGATPEQAAFGHAVAWAARERGRREASILYSFAWRAGNTPATASLGGPEMTELQTLQRVAAGRAATAMRLWHRLFRQAADVEDGTAAIVVDTQIDIDAARAQATTAARRERALSWATRLTADLSPPSPPTPPSPPAKEPIVPLSVLVGCLFAAGWAWWLGRSLKGGPRAPWSKSAASALLLGFLLPGSADAVTRHFPHQELLAQFADAEPFAPESVGFPSAEQIQTRDNDDGVTVIGYLPYWVEPENIPWDQVDVLAYFSVGVNADGSLSSNDHGWGDAGADALIEAAHLAGAQVTIAATRFGGSQLEPLMSSPTARQNCIDNLIAKMIEGGGDGIDIDFEGLDVGNRQDYVDFIIDLRVAMQVAQPGSLLTMATPVIDWEGAYDYDVLADNSDFVFIMGYAFAGTWSNPQPNAPLDGGSPWGSRSLRWSVQDYLQWGGANNAPKFILGLPLYGHTWDTTDDSVPGTENGDISSTFYSSSQSKFAQYGSTWDAVSSTPYTMWQDGSQWKQMWSEDEISIAMKADMAREEGIGGFGFWALNYDAGDEGLWAATQGVLDGWSGSPGDDDDDDDDDDDTGPSDSGVPELLVRIPDAVVVGETVYIDAADSADPDGAGLNWAWTQSGGPTTSIVSETTNRPSFFAELEGVYAISVVLTDMGGDSVSDEYLVRAVPESDADLIDDGRACGGDCSAAGSGTPGLLALCLAGLALIRRRERS